MITVHFLLPAGTSGLIYIQIVVQKVMSVPQVLGLPTLKPQNIVETADVRKFEKWMGVNFATAARHEKLPLMKGAGAQCRETTNWVSRRRLLNWVKILKLEWSSWNSEQFNLVKVQALFYRGTMQTMQKSKNKLVCIFENIKWTVIEDDRGWANFFKTE